MNNKQKHRCLLCGEYFMLKYNLEKHYREKHKSFFKGEPEK
jgi:hypothetical protein